MSGIAEDYYLIDAFGKTVALWHKPETGSPEWEYFVHGAEREVRIAPNEGQGLYGQTNFYLNDHLGNTRVNYKAFKVEPVYETGLPDDYITTYLINTVHDYFPYGKVLREYIHAADERYLSTQHERDAHTGLDYRGARYYDSDVARFLSLDPLAKKFSAISPYNYVYGNPIIVVDPDGKEGIIISGQPGGHNNKEHFLVNGYDRIKSAKKRFKNSSEKVTWLVYDSGDAETGHDPELLSKYQKKAAKAGVEMIVINDEEQLINYVNDKSLDGSDGGRSKDKISSLYYFGHATVGDLEIGYAQPGLDDYVAGSDFESGAFASGCWINLVGGCRTAVGSWNESSVVDEFTEIVDDKSTVNGSSVRVWYPGGVVSDSELVKKNNGEIVTKKGQLPSK